MTETSINVIATDKKRGKTEVTSVKRQNTTQIIFLILSGGISTDEGDVTASRNKNAPITTGNQKSPHK